MKTPPVEAVQSFYEFMKEREWVRLRKELGRPKPWTNDTILQRYKFTNVKREHDRTSVELAKIYRQHMDDPIRVILLNCAIFRYFGTYEFAQEIGWSTSTRALTRIASTAAQKKAAGEKVFTGAYVITNNGVRGPKEDVVCGFIRNLMEACSGKGETFLTRAVAESSWEILLGGMAKVKGFGGTGFMGKEIALDTMFTNFWGTPDGKPEDFNTWCPLGPGGMRGMNRIYGYKLQAKVPKPRTMDHLIPIYEMRHQRGMWPKDFVELDLHDIQFQLCEYDKYLRVKNENGRLRSRYNGVV